MEYTPSRSESNYSMQTPHNTKTLPNHLVGNSWNINFIAWYIGFCKIKVQLDSRLWFEKPTITHWLRLLLAFHMLSLLTYCGRFLIHQLDWCWKQSLCHPLNSLCWWCVAPLVHIWFGRAIVPSLTSLHLSAFREYANLLRVSFWNIFCEASSSTPWPLLYHFPW